MKVNKSRHERRPLALQAVPTGYQTRLNILVNMLEAVFRVGCLIRRERITTEKQVRKLSVFMHGDGLLNRPSHAAGTDVNRRARRHKRVSQQGQRIPEDAEVLLTPNSC